MQWHEGNFQGGPATVFIRPIEEESPPAGGISSTVLREIDFRGASAKLHEDVGKNPVGFMEQMKQRWRDRTEPMKKLRAELANGITAEYLALLSKEYVYRVSDGQSKPVEKIAEELGKSTQTVRGHLWQARKRNLLTGSIGRKGGELTIEALTVLQRMEPPDPRRVDR